MNQNDKSFLEYKGFNLSSLFGLENARQWLKKADPDELFWTDPDDRREEYEVNLDRFMGEYRRTMLLEVVESMIKSLSSKGKQ